MIQPWGKDYSVKCDDRQCNVSGAEKKIICKKCCVVSGWTQIMWTLVQFLCVTGLMLVPASVCTEWSTVLHHKLEVIYLFYASHLTKTRQKTRNIEKY